MVGDVDELASMIVGVGATSNEARALGAVDQLDRRVVAKQQRVGEVTDDGRVGAWVPAQGEEQLVMGGCQSGGAGGVGGEPLEQPQRVPEARQRLVLTRRHRAGHPSKIAEEPIVER